MEIEVNYSYTIDFVSWDCPKCGHHNEFNSYDGGEDGHCQNCNFEIEDYSSRLGECNGDLDTYYLQENEEN